MDKDIFIFSSEDGYKISLHEILVRNFTKIFEMVDLPSTKEADARDPMGGLTIILQDVSKNTLKALAELLYGGKCFVQSRKSKDDLMRLLLVSPDLVGLSVDPTGPPDVTFSDLGDEIGSTESFDTDHQEVLETPTKYAEPFQGENLKIADAESEPLMNLVNKSAKQFNCKKCDKKFKRKGAFVNHLVKNHLVAKKAPSSVIDELKDANRKAPKRSRTSKVYNCKTCNKNYFDKSTLNRHQRVHNRDEIFSCVLCNGTYSEIYNLKKHVGKHHKQVKFSDEIFQKHSIM